jgi:hypothetical protein
MSDEQPPREGEDEDPLPPIAPPLYPGGVGAGSAPPIPPVMPPAGETEEDETG